MNAQSISSVKQEHPTRRANDQHKLRWARWLIVLIALGWGIYQIQQPGRATRAIKVDNRTLFDLALNGNGDAAVKQLEALAKARGGWGPAPGDSVAYDPLLNRERASVQPADFADDCEKSKFDRPGAECTLDFVTQQSLVRFGFFTFADETSKEVYTPRPATDDLLSVYIEEVGHSWQEYFYETEGRGTGERVELMPWVRVKSLSTGWEYQVKRYLFSLDGRWLTLSEAERHEVKSSICDDDGYANPTGKVAPTYGPPPGWPNPEGWPVNAPTAEELAGFCQ